MTFDFYLIMYDRYVIFGWDVFALYCCLQLLSGCPKGVMKSENCLISYENTRLSLYMLAFGTLSLYMCV